MYSEKKLVQGAIFPYNSFIPNHTAFLAYNHAPYIQLHFVYNLISIQKELNLWNVHIHANACTRKGELHFLTFMRKYKSAYDISCMCVYVCVCVCVCVCVLEGG